MSTTSQRESLFGSVLSAYHSGRRRGDSMAKIPSSKLSDKTNKKTGVVMVISVGGKTPKKPTKTADTEKAGQCGVVKK